jgi:hypothetical protein
LGTLVGFPFAGVHIVEATKQLYRPVGVRRIARRNALSLRPALAPSANRSAPAPPARRLAPEPDHALLPAQSSCRSGALYDDE